MAGVKVICRNQVSPLVKICQVEVDVVFTHFCTERFIIIERFILVRKNGFRFEITNQVSTDEVL